jgi:hypothetical protein
MTKAGLVRFDEFEDAVVSVELVARLLPNAKAAPTLLWKWVIMAIHDGLQGAMICVLSEAERASALSDARLKILRWMETGEGDYPNERVESFATLLRLSSAGQRIRPLFLTDQDKRDLEKLNWYRNQFTHLLPEGWNIAYVNIPPILLTAVSTIEQLMLDGVIMGANENQVRRLRKAIQTIRKHLPLRRRRAARGSVKSVTLRSQHHP